jgi:DNA-binding IclR family transcriptional regulator
VIEGVRRTLFVLELTRRLGQITVSVLATQPDWNKASACRYLRDICDAGWLERVSAEGRPKYVLGRKALAFGVDLRF